MQKEERRKLTARDAIADRVKGLETGADDYLVKPFANELLALFLRRPLQVLTRDIILDRVWGMDFEGSSNVMEVYVGYLRAKLEAQGEPRLIYTIRGVGYVCKE